MTINSVFSVSGGLHFKSRHSGGLQFLSCRLVGFCTSTTVFFVPCLLPVQTISMPVDAGQARQRTTSL